MRFGPLLLIDKKHPLHRLAAVKFPEANTVAVARVAEVGYIQVRAYRLQGTLPPEHLGTATVMMEQTVTAESENVTVIEFRYTLASWTKKE